MNTTRLLKHVWPLFGVKHEKLNGHAARLLNNSSKGLYFVEKSIISYFIAWPQKINWLKANG